MPVPRRRKAQGVSALVKSPLMVFKLLDINFVFQNTRQLLFYGFAPTVVVMGMLTEPTPASWFDLINIF